MSTWQPIETAPKDGTRVILAEGEKVFRGTYVIIPFHESRDLDGHYIDHQDHEEFWMADDGDMPDPTHWQPEHPLPAPPGSSAAAPPPPESVLGVAIKALRSAQGNIAAFQPEGDPNPDSDDYDHDAFMWQYYQQAIDSLQRLQGESLE